MQHGTIVCHFCFWMFVVWSKSGICCCRSLLLSNLVSAKFGLCYVRYIIIIRRKSLEKKCTCLFQTTTPALLTLHHGIFVHSMLKLTSSVPWLVPRLKDRLDWDRQLSVYSMLCITFWNKCHIGFSLSLRMHQYQYLSNNLFQS
jgi:hypothetical protein